MSVGFLNTLGINIIKHYLLSNSSECITTHDSEDQMGSFNYVSQIRLISSIHLSRLPGRLAGDLPGLG